MRVLIVGSLSQVKARIELAFKEKRPPFVAHSYQVLEVEDEKMALKEILKDKFDFIFILGSKASFARLIPIEWRRESVCILLDSKRPSLDRLSAFMNNVDGIINLSDLEKLPQLSSEIAKQHEELYRGFLKVKRELETF